MEVEKVEGGQWCGGRECGGWERVEKVEGVEVEKVEGVEVEKVEGGRGC